jgi:tetratricopeptide (TPR) repeat protein
MRVTLVILAFAVLLNGCASAPQMSSASLASAASAAEKRDDWAGAAQLWEQAIQKENGFWQPEFSRSPKIIAIYHYELGRSLGVLGHYEDAERHLLQAFRLDEKFNGPKGMDLVELARLNHARGNDARAASFFDQILPRMDEVAEADPAAHIALLHEAASVYQNIGQNNRAAELNTKAQKFSALHPNARFADDYGWTPYKNAAR